MLMTKITKYVHHIVPSKAGGTPAFASSIIAALDGEFSIGATGEFSTGIDNN